jgi:hypothetical protein
METIIETSVNEVKLARFVVEATVNDYAIKAEVTSRNGKTRSIANGSVKQGEDEVATFEYNDGYTINYSNVEADNAAVGVAVQDFVKSIKSAAWSVSVAKA